MLSIRAFARSAPRTISRVVRTAPPRISRQTSSLRPIWPNPLRFAPAFSTSTFRKAAEGEGDKELIAKLASELDVEDDLHNSGDEVPTSVKDYLENGPFQIQDTPGEEEVVLTRTFGDETIKVTFSIADLNSMDPEADYEDRALGDEESDSDNINQGSDSFKDVPEDAVGEEDGAEESDEPEAFPTRLHISISKPGRGALAIESVAQDGAILIDSVSFYPSDDLASPKTAEVDFKRQSLYAGPPFGNLDPDLQVMFDQYLDDRGVNTALAIFVSDYIDVKEQREYVAWLEGVKGFLEA